MFSITAPIESCRGVDKEAVNLGHAGGAGVRAEKRIAHNSRLMHMRHDVDVSINDVGHVDKAVDFATGQPRTTACAMSGEDGITDRPPMIRVSAKAQEEHRAGRRVSVGDAELLAHDFGHIHAIIFPNAVNFVVAGVNNKDLVLYWVKQLDALLKLMHWRDVGRKDITNAVPRGKIHEVTIEDAVTVVMGLDVVNPCRNLFVIGIFIAKMKVGEREDLQLREIAERALKCFQTSASLKESAQTPTDLRDPMSVKYHLTSTLTIFTPMLFSPFDQKASIHDGS